MTENIRATELPNLDPGEFLKDDADIAKYLSVMIEEGDAGELALALGIAARTRGMAQIAQVTGIGREVPYKALRAVAQTRFDTVARFY